ncbi:GNAT family N-acetyltransferase [Caulobacter sp. S45]|uniref:GNAT family N-acetyltransferase n=1 Tax=Caulobacter sp. S45 TaxID=1641861 RepID=UPI001577585A|nr:GNAT family N-acetyltransferase [Caulobacter sp. S45]
MSDIDIRQALVADIPKIEALIEASVRGLQAGDYDPDQIERSLRLVFGVDRQLIADGTYYVISQGSRFAACGGWSFRRTLFGADAIHSRDDAPLEPGREPAKIRAFFVAPAFARQGLGTRLLAVCEAAAAARGFTACELGATLTGEPLYARHGYSVVERLDTPLSDGVTLPIVRMAKRLAGA